MRTTRLEAVACSITRQYASVVLGDWTTHHHEEEIHSPESRLKLIHEIGHFLTSKPLEGPLKDFKAAEYNLISS